MRFSSAIILLPSVQSFHICSGRYSAATQAVALFSYPPEQDPYYSNENNDGYTQPPKYDDEQQQFYDQQQYDQQQHDQHHFDQQQYEQQQYEQQQYEQQQYEEQSHPQEQFGHHHHEPGPQEYQPQQPDQHLVLSAEDIDAQMSQLRSKYPTSEADYLAAARERSAARVASTERQATDEDWQRAAAEKRKEQGLLGDADSDGWEASRADAGNLENSILIMSEDGGVEGGDDMGGGEPQLLL